MSGIRPRINVALSMIAMHAEDGQIRRADLDWLLEHLGYSTRHVSRIVTTMERLDWIGPVGPNLRLTDAGTAAAKALPRGG